MSPENPDYNAETLVYSLREWERAIRTTASALGPLGDGIIGGHGLTEENAADSLERIADQLDRAAAGLRGLRRHTRFPPDEVEEIEVTRPVAGPTVEHETWAVSGDHGYSIRVVGSEFTARRFLQMTASDRKTGAFRIYSKPGRGYFVDGDSILLNAALNRPNDKLPGGWRERGRA